MTDEEYILVINELNDAIEHHKQAAIDADDMIAACSRLGKCAISTKRTYENGKKFHIKRYETYMLVVEQLKEYRKH